MWYLLKGLYNSLDTVCVMKIPNYFSLKYASSLHLLFQTKHTRTQIEIGKELELEGQVIGGQQTNIFCGSRKLTQIEITCIRAPDSERVVTFIKKYSNGKHEIEKHLRVLQ